MKSTHWYSIKICVFNLFLCQQLCLINGSINELQFNSKYEENSDFKFSPRIVGGRKANFGEFVGIVSIQTWRNEHFCGGTWFKFENRSMTHSDGHADRILTAAHCVVDKKKRKLSKSLLRVMGHDLSISSNASPKRQIRKIREIIPHPFYDPNTLLNDIAVIFLETPFEETEIFAPIELTNKSLIDNQQCSVAGWGYLREGGIQSTELMTTNVSVIPWEKCNYAYDGKVGRHAFCAGALTGGRDTCQGDSGGGILSNNTLVGIVSSGYGCGHKDFPGIYTNVHHYNHWIRQVINSSSRLKQSYLSDLITVAVISFHLIYFQLFSK